MNEPVPPEHAPDPPLSRPVPEIALEPLELSIEPASPDVVLPGEAASLPGAHRGGFTTPPTAPVEVTWQAADGPGPAVVSAVGTATLPVSTSAGWNPGAYALLFAITGLAASLVVGWLFPLGLTAVVFAVIALRRPSQRRRGGWALALALLSLAYSAGWLIYAAVQGGTT